MTRLLPFGLAVLAVVASGCGSSYARTQAPVSVQPAGCPRAALAGWRALAKRIDAPVYCPSWMPQPLDSTIGGDYAEPAYMGPGHSYLVSFLWFEKIPEDPYEVHVNFRGYPGRMTIPTCQNTLSADGKIVNTAIPCFADPRGTVHFGHVTATVYTANQGADTWHVLYAWHYHGSLYTISQHVAPPFTYTTVRKSLDRMLKGLVLVQP